MSLRHAEAEARSAQLIITKMIIDLDLTDPSAAHFESETTIHFDTTGPETFVDFRGTELLSLRLNGVELGHDGWQDGRIALSGLAPTNTLIIRGRMAYSSSGEGLHRHIDPTDGETYLYAMSFLDAAPTWFACFDQPDLKSGYELRVAAPAEWTVIGNGPSTMIESGRWLITQSKPLASYFVTLVAGPYVSVLDDHEGIPLGFHARASLDFQLGESIEDLTMITKQALDYFQRVFGMPYPFDEYHQAFVPDFNAGAMENPGCVTLRDQLLFRGRATHGERTKRAGVIAHEMAHMWFGDLVTMRWWNDLWLNESFAEYLAQQCCSEATAYPAWTEFGVVRKDWGSIADQSPSTHPVASNGARDAESALQDFDGISYAKGAAVLKQLHAYLGDEAFLAGLRSYFSDFAYGNASFDDLIAHWSASVGESQDRDHRPIDLQAWSQSWLRTAGMDTLDVLESPPQIMINRRPSPDGATRPHRIVVGSVDHSGAVTAVQELVVDDDREALTVPSDSALVIPDVTDSTWAKIRFGDDGWRRLAAVLGSITDESASVVIHNAVRDAVRDAQLAPAEALDLLCDSLPTRRSEVIVTQLLAFAASQLAGAYSPVAERPARLARVHDLATVIMESSEPGSDRQLAAFRACVRTSVDDQLLRGWHDETHLPPGLDLDPELLWGVVRQIVLLTGDDTLIDAALGRDPSASGRNHAAQARASIPSPEAKEAAWKLLMQPSELSAYELYATADGFFDPRQTTLTAPYVPRYFAEIGATADFRSGWVLGGVATKAFPSTAATPETVELAEQTLSGELAAPVRRAVVDETDRLRRAVASLSRFS